MGLNCLKVVRLAALFKTVFVQSKKMQVTPCPKRSNLNRPPGVCQLGKAREARPKLERRIEQNSLHNSMQKVGAQKTMSIVSLVMKSVPVVS